MTRRNGRWTSFSDDGGALGEITAEVFTAVAHLLNLDLDIVFVDSPANPATGSAAG